MPEPFADARRGWTREPALLALAVLAVAVAARVSVPVPGSPVPQSLQTLAVVLVGAFLGPRGGGGALALYLLVGALGVPVFADGAAGAAHLVGPSAGYLLGFVLAAVLVGWGVGSGGLLRAFLAMLCAHLVILGLGWARLAPTLGVLDALRSGVLPFLWGGVAKSAAGAAAWAIWCRRPSSVGSPAAMSTPDARPRSST